MPIEAREANEASKTSEKTGCRVASMEGEGERYMRVIGDGI